MLNVRPILRWAIARGLELVCAVVAQYVLFGPFHHGFQNDAISGIVAYLIFGFILIVGSGYIVSTVIFSYLLRNIPLVLFGLIAAIIFTVHCYAFFYIAGGWDTRLIVKATAMGALGVFVANLLSQFVLRARRGAQEKGSGE